MRPTEEIEQRLQKYPQIRFDKSEYWIRIYPADESGFEVSLIEYENGATVAFDGWHEEFSDLQLALETVAFGLSNACRLRVEYRGRFAHIWNVEEKIAGDWHSCEWVGLSETGLLFFPFWLKRKTRFLQNNLIIPTI